jgi:hypothetical protein
MDHRIDQTSSSPQHSGYGVIEDVNSVTDCVVRAMSRAPNARLREIMESFVRHLHAFCFAVSGTDSAARESDAGRKNDTTFYRLSGARAKRRLHSRMLSSSSGTTIPR